MVTLNPTPQKPPPMAAPTQSQAVQQQPQQPMAAAPPTPSQAVPQKPPMENAPPPQKTDTPPVQQQTPSALRSNKPASPPPLSDVRGIINEFKGMD